MVEDWGGLNKQGWHYFLVIPWLSSTAARTRNLPVGVAGAVGFLLSPAVRPPLAVDDHLVAALRPPPLEE